MALKERTTVVLRASCSSHARWNPGNRCAHAVAYAAVRLAAAPLLATATTMWRTTWPGNKAAKAPPPTPLNDAPSGDGAAATAAVSSVALGALEALGSVAGLRYSS